MAWHPGLYGFQTCALCHKCHTENFLQISRLCRLFFKTVFFQSSPKIHDHRWRSEQRPIWKLKALWSLKALFHNHGALKPTQSCVYVTNPCINCFVPTSVTREYHLSQDTWTSLSAAEYGNTISAHLQNTLLWASWETQYLNLFSANFRSCSLTCIRKHQMCVEDPVEKIHACSIFSARMQIHACSIGCHFDTQKQLKKTLGFSIFAIKTHQNYTCCCCFCYGLTMQKLVYKQTLWKCQFFLFVLHPYKLAMLRATKGLISLSSQVMHKT